jgi:nitric oxide reductase NorD protein
MLWPKGFGGKPAVAQLAKPYFHFPALKRLADAVAAEPVGNSETSVPGRFCCKSPLLGSASGDSVVVTRTSAGASDDTNDRLRSGGDTVLGIELDATALLAHAMDGLGDPFAIHAFCSNGREEVHYYRIKDFTGPYDGAAKQRLAGLSGKLSTRIGAALRHAGRELSWQLSHRRLLLVITDGEPSDIDVGDKRYLVEDARKAVRSLTHHGIDVFCVGLDGQGDSYLTRMFERRNVLQIDRLERLPEKLPMLYFRLRT